MLWGNADPTALSVHCFDAELYFIQTERLQGLE